jgi:hypothetical protein
MSGPRTRIMGKKKGKIETMMSRIKNRPKEIRNKKHMNY